MRLKIMEDLWPTTSVSSSDSALVRTGVRKPEGRNGGASSRANEFSLSYGYQGGVSAVPITSAPPENPNPPSLERSNCASNNAR
jgi:hypothetical protein